MRRVAVRDIVLSGPAPDVKKLADSIGRVGLLQAPTLEAAGDGRYRVRAGRRRVWALRSLGWEMIDARVYDEGDLSEVERVGILLTENGNRSENPVAELAAIERLVASGLTAKGIAKSLGQPSTWVKARLALRNLSPDLRKALETGTLTLSTALRAARLNKEEQGALVEKWQEEGAERISLDAVEAMKKKEPVSVPLRMFATDPTKGNEPLERVRRIKEGLRDLLKELKHTGNEGAAKHAQEAYECLGRLRAALETKEGKD
ncbi:MAG: ParB N-terminal domain-containing protein [Nitrospirae bacterium]|nr:ParB N-terminal domain-containing protein [Nitrospirota bacterium]